MRNLTWLAALSTLTLATTACKKKDDATPTKPAATKPTNGAVGSAVATTPPGTTPTPTPTPATPSNGAPSPGVEAGGILRDASEGAGGVITAAAGTVQVRRVGEAEFTEAKADTALYAGDQVRTGEASTATVVLADESTIEVAEVSTIAISSRDASADPASGAAVLAGLARFSVTPRAPGEGAFTVYTPTAVVLTKGTVYAVGVAIDGSARVGVESGEIEAVALANLDAPVAVTGGNAAEFGMTGGAEVAAWPADDWGTWRDDADAGVTVEAAVDAHGEALEALGAELTAAYATLDAEATAAATFEATAATSLDAGATADYQAAAPGGVLAIDASFDLATKIQALTWAYAGHASLATDLYVRHPEVKGHWEVVSAKADAAILWPKRFELTADAYLTPLRAQYYVHHPRGRVRAALVGIEVPTFYAAVNVPPPPRAEIDAAIKVKLWAPPVIKVTAQARPVWIAMPDASWHASIKVKPAAMRGKARWYVRPPQLKAKALLGVTASGTWTTGLKVNPPALRADLRGKLTIKPVGTRIKIKAPDLAAAARARLSIKLDAHGGLPGDVVVIDHRGGASAGGKIEVKDHRDDLGAAIGAGIGGKIEIKDHRDDVKGGAGGKIEIKDHRDDVKGDVDGKIKVKDKRDKGAGAVKGGISIKGGASIKIGK